LLLAFIEVRGTGLAFRSIDNAASNFDFSTNTSPAILFGLIVRFFFGGKVLLMLTIRIFHYTAGL
jgi:hypothetical protein